MIKIPDKYRDLLKSTPQRIVTMESSMADFKRVHLIHFAVSWGQHSGVRFSPGAKFLDGGLRSSSNCSGFTGDYGVISDEKEPSRSPHFLSRISINQYSS